MLWMSGDLLFKGYEDKVILVEDNSVKGYVDGVKWKKNLVLRSRYIQKYGLDELKLLLKGYIEKTGPLPKEGLLFSEKAKRFL